MSGLLDLLTGGENEQAAEALQTAQGRIGAVNAPTASQLTLPELQQYVNAGMMTPAQMEAYLQKDNAYNSENIDQTGTGAQVAALNQLSGVANAGAEGTPVEQAQQAQSIQAMNQAVSGQRGAIAQEAEARGTPAALVQAALSNQTVGQEAQQGYQNSLQAQAQAYQQAVNAMSQRANAGVNLQGQQNTQANTVAQASNAMQQFNAANQQNASANNANLKQQANAYNAENAQNVSNQNTGNANARTQYNAQVPQTVFQDQMQKATGQAGISGQQANQHTQAGQQEAGLWGGLIGSAATAGGDYMTGNGIAGASGAKTGGPGFGNGPPASANTQQYAPYAKGGIVGGHEYCYHEGGICMEGGGMVPGHAKVPGDSLKNDTVTAKVSPGEAVIPRTAVQQHPQEVLNLMSGHSESPHHPQDVATLLTAMKHLRGAA